MQSGRSASLWARRVAARAPQATGGTEVLERHAARGAARGLGGGKQRLLLHGLEEVAQRVLRGGDRRLHAALRRAPLAQVELRDGALHDLRQVHHGVMLLALVAEHQVTS